MQTPEYDAATFAATAADDNQEIERLLKADLEDAELVYAWALRQAERAARRMVSFRRAAEVAPS
jgi:hypothetical protein